MGTIIKFTDRDGIREHIKQAIEDLTLLEQKLYAAKSITKEEALGSIKEVKVQLRNAVIEIASAESVGENKGEQYREYLCRS